MPMLNVNTQPPSRLSDTHARTHAHPTHARTHAHTHTLEHAHAHAHSLTHTHTHTHTHTPISEGMSGRIPCVLTRMTTFGW